MKRLSFLTLFIITSLSCILLPQNSMAVSTPRAWTADSLPMIESSKARVIFGDQVHAVDRPVNWSIRDTPKVIDKATPWIRPTFHYAIPACNSKIAIGCIDSVSYKIAGGDWQVGTLSSRELADRAGENLGGTTDASTGKAISETKIGEWPADMKNHAPAAGRASYWNFTKASHGGGTEYLLRVTVRGDTSAEPIFSTWNPVSGTREWKNGIVQRYLEMAIFPVDRLTEYDFPENLQIKVKLKLGVVARDLWGWFDGRVINPEIVLDSESSDGIVQISGSPAKVPIGLTPTKNVSDFSSDFSSRNNCPSGVLPSSCLASWGGTTAGISTDGYYEISDFNFYEKEFGLSKTIAYKNAWWVKTTPWPDVANVADCPTLQNGFTGIVTTNATMYGTSAPTWDSSDKTFVFQVASPHLDLAGQPNEGFYSLVIPKEIAECRWGKDIAKSKIVVSIISADGSTNVGVSNYSLKNNLITFNVSGFTYSSPKIKVGLTSQSTGLKTIICAKGKVIKKVTSAKPVCPAGYKKK